MANGKPIVCKADDCEFESSQYLFFIQIYWVIQGVQKLRQKTEDITSPNQFQNHSVLPATTAELRRKKQSKQVWSCTVAKLTTTSLFWLPIPFKYFNIQMKFSNQKWIIYHSELSNLVSYKQGVWLIVSQIWYLLHGFEEFRVHTNMIIFLRKVQINVSKRKFLKFIC